MSYCNPKLTKENSPKVLNKLSCPKCGIKGAKVEHITVQNLLLDKFKSQIDNESFYTFCKNPSCDVVYYPCEGVIFYKNNLKEKVTLKDDELDVKTCYCFNVTKGDIVDEVKRTGDCKVLEIIKAKMKDHGCFCETSNPQGSCCLANNMVFIKETKNKIQQGRFDEER